MRGTLPRDPPVRTSRGPGAAVGPARRRVPHAHGPVGHVARRPRRRRPAPQRLRPRLRRRRLGADRGPRPLAQRRRPSPTATARSSTAPASSSRPASRAPATGSCSTGSSTRATSGSTAPTSATRRATSSRHAYEITELARLGTEHVLAVEVTCAPPGDKHARSATSPACSSTPGLARPDVEPGRPVAAGARRAHRAGAHRPAAGAVHRGRRRAGPAAAARPSSTATWPAPCASARRSTTGSSGSASSRWRAGSNQVEWSFGVDSPDAVVAVVARRAAAVDGDGQRLRRPRGQRRPHRAHRLPPGVARATGRCR